jgi:serine phosphatase RsbU (regulator of sigma subunit)
LFDAFRIDEYRWGIAIGDVCGHGTEAAAMTGLVRHTLRVAARYSYSPAEVLHAIHTAMGDLESSTFCTVCFITFTPDGTGGGELVVSLGGHPQPLLRRRNREIEAIGVPGTVLGMVEPSLVDVAVDVEPGDTLVMYTDGLTDAPRDEAVPMSEIEELLIERGDIEVGALADSIRTLKRRRRPQGSSDDTAMLIVRFGS